MAKEQKNQTLLEKVKTFLTTGTQKEPEYSSEILPTQVTVQGGDEEYYPFLGGFADGIGGGLYAQSDKVSTLERQKQKIQMYRSIARNSDVNDGLDEICNEIIFSTDMARPLEVNIDEENEKIKEAIQDKFNKIYSLMNLDRNLFNIVRTTYTDGQMIALLRYDKNSTKNGVQHIDLIDPCYFFYDKDKDTYRYLKKQEGNFVTLDSYKFSEEEYSPEEIVREDFGLYNDLCIESYLENAIKTANQLKTLEDLLIPMRFSRSVSRRVFNVDIGDIPTKQGESVLAAQMQQYKYKKFYNVETGEVTNQQHITSMVEDYWFANRSGGKGTTVDTIDETGNLGELGDIIYFYKKLYKSMKIPTSRVPYQTDVDSTFDFSSTNVTREDLKFFMFVSKVRKVYSSFLKKILQRELISSGVLKAAEWEEYKEKITISFANENKFIEKMNLDAWTSKLDIYQTARDYAGSVFSYRKIMKEVFRFSDEEIDENLKEIAKEKKDPKFKDFYKTDEEEQGF